MLQIKHIPLCIDMRLDSSSMFEVSTLISDNFRRIISHPNMNMISTYFLLCLLLTLELGHTPEDKTYLTRLYYFFLQDYQNYVYIVCFVPVVINLLYHVHPNTTYSFHIHYSFVIAGFKYVLKKGH